MVSYGLMVKAHAYRSRGQWFDSTSAISKLEQFCSPHFACLSEETVKAFGPFYLVSMSEEVKDPTQGNGKRMDSLTVEDILQ